MTLGVSMLDATSQKPCRVRRKKTQTEDFNRLEQHLSLCKRRGAWTTGLDGMGHDGAYFELVSI